MTPEVTYDKKRDTAYIKFSDRPVVRSIETDDELLVIDLNEDNIMVGVEVLSVLKLGKCLTPISQSTSAIPIVPREGFDPSQIAAFVFTRAFQSDIHSF